VNALQFISSLIGSLAWPGAVIAGVIVFRRPLKAMLTSRDVKRVKAGPSGLEVEYFDQKLKDASGELVAAHSERTELPYGSSPSNAVASAADFMEEMGQLARVSPTAVILESYARLERALRGRLDTSPVSMRAQEVSSRDSEDSAASDRLVSVRTLARRALDQEILTPSEFAALEDFTVLRNIVAHGGPDDIDEQRALSYARLVSQLIVRLMPAGEDT